MEPRKKIGLQNLRINFEYNGETISSNGEPYKSLNEVKEKGQLIKDSVKDMPHVVSVSGLGMMIGVELDGVEAKDVLAKCRDKGVLFLTAKTKIRMLPPLIMTKEEIQKGMDVLKSVLEEM